MRSALPDATLELRIDARLVSKLNLADFRNAIPVMGELQLVNETEQTLEQVRLTLDCVPPFLKPKQWHIDRLAAGSHYLIHDLDVRLDGGKLAQLTEAETVTVTLTLLSSSPDTDSGHALAQREFSLELLPRNQWAGLSHLPEMIAAFVQPNDPAVERVLKQASRALQDSGRNPAIDGYMGGGRRAFELASAIWVAVAGMKLTYALPPASFEQTGQKVRGPTHIEASGLGTCLDLSLLFCAALEQAGLNPLIVFTEGHAFAGLWLQQEEFSSAVIDDVTALRKRVLLNELLLFETTLITQHPAPSFQHAIERGKRQIEEDHDSPFLLAVDIQRARRHRILPLASDEQIRREAAPAEDAPVALSTLPVIEDAPDVLMDALPVASPEEKPSTPEGRLQRWQNKLLDLSLKNQLLHFTSKKSLKLDIPDPQVLEQRLASGKSMKLLPRPDLMQGADPRSRALHEKREREDVYRQHALDALGRGEVLVNAGEETETRLIQLFRESRTALQEGGSNTLYLALGFLSWQREDRKDRPCRAPLILLPVTLERKSVRSGFTLRAHEDEPVFNPTLQELLRQEFQLHLNIGELQWDDGNFGVADIWRKVGQAVKDIKGWEIQTDVVLAQFSFAKYLMWKDLAEHSEQLRDNPVVRHLLDTPRDPYPSDTPFPEPNTLDQEFDPAQLFCPLPADSSQLSAVLAASRGKDFVLIGPPGTGKSQTIANLIAQSLAEGRRVLFVAEKIAALDVVYRRLREVGLGNFCLQLHSNKARKLDVLEQLKKAWESSAWNSPTQWQAEAERLKEMRDALNLYVQRLHHRHTNGLSLFDAMATVSRHHDLPKLPLHWPAHDAHDAQGMQQLRTAVERLQVHAGDTGHHELSTHPLAWVGQRDWSPSWQQQLMAAARELLPTAQAALDAAHRFAQSMGLAVDDLTPAASEGLALLAEHLPKAHGRHWEFVLEPSAHHIGQRLLESAALLRQRAALDVPLSAPWPKSFSINHEREQARLSQNKTLYAWLGDAWGKTSVTQFQQNLEWLNQISQQVKNLSLPYNKRINTLNIVQCRREWARAEQAIWPKSWWIKRNIKKRLRSAASTHSTELDAAGDLQRLLQIRTLRDKIVQRRSEIEQALSASDAMRDLAAGVWQGLNTSPDDIEQACRFQANLAAAVARLAKKPAHIKVINTALQPLFADANLLLAPDGLVTLAGSHYLDCFRQLQPKRQALALLGGFDDEAQTAWQALSVNDLIERSQAILQSEPELQRWCVWRDTRTQALAHGLAPLVEAIEKGMIASNQTQRAFELSYAHWWLDAVVNDQEPVIRRFASAEHEQRIENFRQLDERFTGLTRDWLRARLSADLPTQRDVKRNSSWGILRHEMQKKRRHMALRELMTKIPDALTKLTPCLLMSPLSIAQYLGANSSTFDLVIFDEASQIPPWDAIGAMARARQVVMVGDPKQLPPTNFFNRAQSDQDDDDVEVDMESILDECQGANLPERNLNWHYRSRHETLIAFSNQHYYDNRLVTFPAPVTKDDAVSLHLVSGTHAKGGDRTNPNEAKAVVADIVTRLTEPDFRRSGLTMGVVTFNANQQKLIEDLLDQARREHPEIESYFVDDNLEPVFVKNLESVQGDERDIIYFSLTYGPDSSGRLSLASFNQLTRDGGERRLNVAITRARHEMRVFSSFRAEQLDLSRTSAKGVRDLKHFLEFAERGERALLESDTGSQGGFESPFEQAVARALEQRGWRVQTQIGVSAFRIDLGIVDPDAPGRYLAGVECDGATYHRSATARDRDKLREQVLRGLGWEIVRVWSTDWWLNPARTLDKLDTRLRDLLKKSRAERDVRT